MTGKWALGRPDIADHGDGVGTRVHHILTVFGVNSTTER